MANPARLAIVLAGGMVLIWDVQGEFCPQLSRLLCEGSRSAGPSSPEDSVGQGAILGQCQSGGCQETPPCLFFLLRNFLLCRQHLPLEEGLWARGGAVCSQGGPERCPAAVPVRAEGQPHSAAPDRHGARPCRAADLQG